MKPTRCKRIITCALDCVKYDFKVLLQNLNSKFTLILAIGEYFNTLTLILIRRNNFKLELKKKIFFYIR